jgi:hypothetical protein
MPETAVDEYGYARTSEHDIGSRTKLDDRAAIDAESQSLTMQGRTQRDLRRRISLFGRSHAAAYLG